MIPLVPRKRREFRYTVTAESCEQQRAQCRRLHGPGCYVCGMFVRPHDEFYEWWQWLFFRWARVSVSAYK